MWGWWRNLSPSGMGEQPKSGAARKWRPVPRGVATRSLSRVETEAAQADGDHYRAGRDSGARIECSGRALHLLPESRGLRLPPERGCVDRVQPGGDRPPCARRDFAPPHHSRRGIADLSSFPAGRSAGRRVRRSRDSYKNVSQDCGARAQSVVRVHT